MSDQGVDASHLFRRKVFIPHIPRSITTEKLKEYFSVFGRIQECGIPNRSYGSHTSPKRRHSSEYAFVTFAAAESAQEALQLSHHTIEGHEFQVRPARPAAGHGCKVHVSNLPLSVTEAALLECFSRFGNVTCTIVVRNRLGHSRGYGFVHFSSQAEALRATTCQDAVVLDEKKLTVSLAHRSNPTLRPRTEESPPSEVPPNYQQVMPYPPPYMHMPPHSPHGSPPMSGPLHFAEQWGYPRYDGYDYPAPYGHSDITGQLYYYADQQYYPPPGCYPYYPMPNSPTRHPSLSLGLKHGDCEVDGCGSTRSTSTSLNSATQEPAETEVEEVRGKLEACAVSDETAA